MATSEVRRHAAGAAGAQNADISIDVLDLLWADAYRPEDAASKTCSCVARRAAPDGRAGPRGARTSQLLMPEADG